MASSFKSLNLFGSGPHRFAVGRQGQFVVAEIALNNPVAGSRYLGLVELEVIVRGRLVAASDSALWTIRDAITAQLLDPPAPGTLIDHHGRSWADMSFVRFEPGDRTDRGRTVSLAYEARFLRFKVYPQGDGDPTKD
ncbi:MAG: hypothetical protein JNM80_12425 [Phycisphaerae bacterium]|nr:hypothetical protein [Phycisphaerae bacterium]